MSLKKLIDLDLLDRFLDKVKELIPSAATNTPQMDGTAAVGSSAKYAKEDHVHPTDSSLISLGLTGTELVDGDSLALIKTQGNYYFNGSGTISGAPTSSKFKMVVIKTGNDTNGLSIGHPCQILFADEGASSKIYYRYYWSGNLWRDWQTLSNNLSKGSRTVIPSTGANLNDYKAPGSYSFASNGSITNSPLPDSSYAFTLFVIEGNNTYGHGCSQVIFPIDATVGATFTADVYFRRYSPNASDGGWSDWVNIRNPELVNGHTVESDVPANAVFTDTTYESKTAASGGTDVSLVTTGEKATWNAKGTYSKPSGGIPDSDIASAATWNAHAVTNKGSAFASGLYKITTNSEGHVTGATAVAKSDITALGIPESDTTYTPASANPLMDGTVAVGTSTKYAREDHVHPKDTSLLSLSMDGTEIPSGADLNSYTEPGNYYCRSVSIASTLLNCPIVTEFKMIVMRNKQTINDACTQIIFPSIVFTSIVSATSGGIESGIFYRIYNPNVWCDWIGVNNRYILTSNDDIDNCIKPGIYHCQSNSYANTILNGPTTNKVFSVLVIEGVYSRTCQIGFVASTGSIYFRFHSGATWTNWFDIRNPSTINGHTVLSDVPANAVFTDTTYTPASNDPLMDNTTAAVGTSLKYAREDHVHPRDQKALSLVEPTNTIPESADLDGYYTAGTYLCPSNAIASTLLHAPENDDAFVLVVMRLFEASPRTYQFAFINAMHPGVSSATIYFRYHSTVWSDWFDVRNPSSINGHSVQSDVPANLAVNGLYYGECSTAAGTAAKTVTLTNGDGFSLVEGAKICIRFANTNSASNPTLNVNDTGAKAVVRFGTTVIGTTAGGTGCWSAGSIVLFVYDGTSWVEHFWNNTTYSSMSVSEYTAGTGTTARLMTAARLKAAIKMHSAPDVYTATIPTTGWTTASYGAYIDVTFTGATFAADDTVFVDLNLSDDTNLQLINDSWACLLRATPTASSAVIRFKFREIPTVAIPVRAVVT